MRTLVVGLLAAVLLVTAGCGGGSDEHPGRPAAARLAAAKKAFDASPALHITLSADRLPRSVAGLLSAEGEGTHQPGFDGEIKVVQSGLSLTVPVVAVHGKTWAKLGFWQQVDPRQYNAPDPAGLMSTSHGLSSVLTRATKIGRPTTKRQGSDTVTEIDAKVPGTLMAGIVPSADPNSLFDAAFTLDTSGHLVQMALSGTFYPGAGDVTYTFAFSGYGSKATVHAP